MRSKLMIAFNPSTGVGDSVRNDIGAERICCTAVLRRSLLAFKLNIEGWVRYAYMRMLCTTESVT